MIPYSTQRIEEDDIQAVISALRSTHLAQGALMEEFERALCIQSSSAHAISFNSATSALYALYGAYILCYKQLNNTSFSAAHIHKIVHSNDPIYFITTPISFVATTNMMLHWGITPIFCDIKNDGNIDENAIQAILETHPQKNHIKAIVSVDYAGKSVEIDTLSALAKEYNLMLFSDSSHAFGGSYYTRPIGSLADATIFSFHALKSITTAEGGAIVTNDERIAHFARLIRSHGVQKGELWEYDCQLAGFNFRLNELGAALGLSQICKLQSFINTRRKIAQFYDQYFSNNPYFDTISIQPHIQSSHHLYPILLRPHLHQHKKKIFSLMQEQGLGVQVHYKPIYQFSYYQHLFDTISLSKANSFYTAEISIPCHQSLDIPAAQKIADNILTILAYVQKEFC